MWFRQVARHEIVQFGVAALLLDAALQRAGQRLGREIVLRSEMPVESAVRETGPVHDRVDANAIEAMLTKHSRRGLYDPLAILRRLFPAHPHLSSSLAHPLTGYMTTAIYQNRCRSSFINDARRPRVSNFARDA